MPWRAAGEPPSVLLIFGSLNGPASTWPFTVRLRFERRTVGELLEPPAIDKPETTLRRRPGLPRATDTSGTAN